MIIDDPPTAAEPPSGEPVTAAPVTAAPLPSAPTAAPVTDDPPTAAEPPSGEPVTAAPVTAAPLPSAPTAAPVIDDPPTAAEPPSGEPVTAAPLPSAPTAETTTAERLTGEPATTETTATTPTTTETTAITPTTAEPTTSERTTAEPTTAEPTTSELTSEPLGHPRTDRNIGSGHESYAQDDRLRLFAFANAEKSTQYLWALRAMERSRANYVVLLHANDVASSLASLADEYRSRTDVPALSAEELTPLLDQLFTWQLLDRSYDGARAATLAEYRNRHYVYQFSQLGYRAYRAVEDVLAARLDDATLSRLVLPELLADLDDLAVANREGNSELVYRKLSRLDSALNEMAERAARFYLMLSDLARTNETSAEVFLAHKDALLAHLREFSSELARYAPKLAAAVAEVEATGVQRLLEHAAEADERIFRSPADRLADWQQRWSGLVSWFATEASRRSEAERLQDGTVSAVSAILALLRRVTEARRGGVSRESQLRHLAGWFIATPDLDAAHALFAVTFDVSRPRHVSVVHPDQELIPTRRTWWEAPPVEVSRTLVETGRTASPGIPGRVDRNDAGRRRMLDTQLADQQARILAADSLAALGVSGRTLSEDETALLFGLLDVALGARVPVTGRTAATGSTLGVRLTLTPSEESMSISTIRGVLHLDRMTLAVTPAISVGSRP